MPITTVALSFVLLAAAPSVHEPPRPQQEGTYRTLLVRAAPGHLQDVLDAIAERLPAYPAAGEESPLVLRHSQGDQWDLMLLFPLRSVEDWFGARTERWRAASPGTETEAAFERRIEPWIAWREETFVAGPAVSTLRTRDADAGYYHVEMFVALPGRRADLLQQRAMENEFLESIGRSSNLIFTRIAGGAWDAYTIGFYRDLQHYAEPGRLTAEAEELAAQEAGFESRRTIGTYLRELIASHHDTLATRVH